MKKAFLTMVITGAVLMTSLVCEARTTRETTYRYQQIWSTAVRFLRVDNGFEIKEQDKETGYVLFAYPNAGRSLMGSVELIPTVRSDKKYITVALRIQDMPSYVEVVLIDKLVRKLRNEYGRAPLPQTVKKKTKSAEKKKKSKDDETSDSEPEPIHKKENSDEIKEE